eukprot:GSMAST32.ASY1.ANO1.1244.1 assembled CDS
MASTSFPTLAGAPINLSLLRETGKKELNLFVFKENDVKEFKELSWEKLTTEHPTVIYIVRPDLLMMKQIAKQIQDDMENDNNRRYALYFVPRRTFICIQILKEEGVFHDIQLGDFPIDLIPFESDILSMELHSSYKDCFLLNDTTSLFYIARRVRRSEIDVCIVLDRQVDVLTPMVMPLTYEGLIDEIVGIENGLVYVDQVRFYHEFQIYFFIFIRNFVPNKKKQNFLDDDSRSNNANAGGKTAQNYLRLNNNSTLYAEARDANISAIGPLLQEKSREIHAGNSVQDLKAFVKQIPALKESFAALTAHTHLAESIFKVTNSREFRQQWQVERVMMEGGSGLEFIEESISDQRPLAAVLRLLCLHSLTQGGVKLKEYHYLRTEVLQTYGYEVILTLNNLDKLGLFCKRGSSSLGIGTNWATLRNKLKLIFNDVKCDNEPDDIAYVTSGYAPLSVRLTQLAIAGQWQKKHSTLKLLPGPQIERKNRRKVVLVFVVGGITFLEIAALRHIARPQGQKESQFDIIVASTKLISGKSFMNSIVEDMQSRLNTEM